MEQVIEDQLQESDKTTTVFYWMCWNNSVGEARKLLVVENKMASYVELYQLKGVEVWFEDE